MSTDDKKTRGLSKVAWIRDPAYPVGKSAPGRLQCRCGFGPLVYFEPGPDVVCQCGSVYSWDGWLQGGTNNRTPYFSHLMQQQTDRFWEAVAEAEAWGQDGPGADQEPDQDVGPQEWPPPGGEFLDGEFADPRRFTDPDWGTY